MNAGTGTVPADPIAGLRRLDVAVGKLVMGLEALAKAAGQADEVMGRLGIELDQPEMRGAQWWRNCDYCGRRDAPGEAGFCEGCGAPRTMVSVLVQGAR